MLVLVPPYRQNCNALWDILLGQCISDVHQALRCIVGYIDCPFYSGQLLLNIPHQYKLAALCRVQGAVWDPAIVLCVNTNCVSASEIILTPDLNTYAELQLQPILSRYQHLQKPNSVGTRGECENDYAVHQPIHKSGWQDIWSQNTKSKYKLQTVYSSPSGQYCLLTIFWHLLTLFIGIWQ